MSALIRTRFAPSPTGYLHVGGARTALFSWLYARRHGGEFLLRIEDTDLERSTPESVQAILDGMAWLDLYADAEPIFQTHRFERYNAVIDTLLAKGLAYRCSCSKERLETLREGQMQRKEKPKYDGRCRHQSVDANAPHVIRFRNPTEGAVVVDDQIRGKMIFANSELDDLIIRRSDGAPTYNLSVVVDDFDMGITDVIRGDDHISNTPRQINLLRAIGGTPLRYAHLPMILGDDGSRLSKRHGAVGVMQYAEDGYLPEALLNYLLRLGWSHGEQEIFSRQEMIALFDLNDVNRSPSSFNTEKLRWLNQHYLKEADLSRLATLLRPFLARHAITVTDDDHLQQVIAAQRERAQTLVELAEVCRFYYQEFADYDAAAAKKSLTPAALVPLQTVHQHLVALSEWQRASLHQTVSDTVAEWGVGFGKVAMPLRIAVTGGAPSPDLDLTLSLLGRERTLARLERAISYLGAL
ncbi:MAG: glutamate--tRNA ligase [Gammaproteobacteria bacterium]|nr:glutamate--tRNA ligase [Gammaproteobacteria bacterium]